MSDDDKTSLIGAESLGVENARLRKAVLELLKGAELAGNGLFSAVVQPMTETDAITFDEAHFWARASRACKAADLGSELKHHLVELEGEACTGDDKHEMYDHCTDLMRQMNDALDHETCAWNRKLSVYVRPTLDSGQAQGAIFGAGSAPTALTVESSEAVWKAYGEFTAALRDAGATWNDLVSAERDRNVKLLRDRAAELDEADRVTFGRTSDQPSPWSKELRRAADAIEGARHE